MADGSRFYETLNLSIGEAIRVHQVLESQRLTGQLNIESFYRSSITMDDLRTRYYSYRADQVGFGHIKKDTHVWEVHGINLFVSVVGPNKPLHLIDTDVFIQFVKTLQTTKSKSGDFYQPTTINDYRKAVAGMFSWALSQKLIEQNPIFPFKPLRVRSGRRALSSSEVSAISGYLSSKSSWQ